MSVKISVLEKKTSKELYQYIQPNSRFVAQAIQYAFDILQKRGEVFDEEETHRIHKLIAERQSNEHQEVINSEPWDKNSTEDHNAIQLFSQLAIWGFSIVFGVVFGSVLLTINFKTLGKKKLTIGTLVFGILFTVLQVFLISYLDENNMSFRNQTYVFSAIGAIILHYLFWDNYIATDLKYKKRSALLPLVVCILIYIPIFIILIK